MAHVLSPSSVTRRDVQIVRVVFLVALVLAAALFVHRTVHWALTVDPPIMHYVNFLMEHGRQPYADITDNNMPGAYLTEGWAMHLFGRGDVAWRVYDYAVLLLLTAGMAVIARPWDWLAGVYAGGIFALMHGAEGPWFAGEREELLTALLAVACAFLFEAERRRRPVLVAGFGLCAGMAASIKPTVTPLVLVGLLLLWRRLARTARPARLAMAWGVGGVVVAAALNVGFLVRHHAVGGFWFVLHTITPAYVSLNHPGWPFLILHALPWALLPAIALGLLAWAMDRDDDAARDGARQWEITMLLCVAAMGLLSYFLQQKGFFHHRYLLVAFVLLLTGIALVRAAHGSGWLRVVGCVGLLVPVFGNMPEYVEAMKWMPARSALTTSLEADLQALGPDRLQGEVQCFDLVFGCLNALYHLHLVENTGFTGDLLLFQPRGTVATAYYRGMFSASQATHPAAVYVVTNELFGGENSFAKMQNWPEFERYLAAHYTLAVTRVFPMVDRPAGQPMPLDKARAYRIYVRNESALLPVALAEGRKGPEVIE